jgi:hypothetical protein
VRSDSVAPSRHSCRSIAARSHLRPSRDTVAGTLLLTSAVPEDLSKSRPKPGDSWKPATVPRAVLIGGWMRSSYNCGGKINKDYGGKESTESAPSRVVTGQPGWPSDP